MQDCGIEPAANVTVQLSLEGPQEGSISSDISKALSGNKKAKVFFDGLPTFYRKNFIRWIESAKREQTRIKRINEMINLLSEGKLEK